MLPSQQARREIIAIHTKVTNFSGLSVFSYTLTLSRKTWNPPVEPKLLEEVADLCVGYCGADIKSLATEAALRALRR
jgi:SpoVK/Ycf46/Vps4 family AAA+-type ATPase